MTIRNRKSNENVSTCSVCKIKAASTPTKPHRRCSGVEGQAPMAKHILAPAANRGVWS